jgi:hypothetical protein
MSHNPVAAGLPTRRDRLVLTASLLAACALAWIGTGGSK